jgi:hypothetical protein
MGMRPFRLSSLRVTGRISPLAAEGSVPLDRKDPSMTISDRYREIAREVHAFVAGLGESGEGAENRRFREAAKAVAALDELLEAVGDIPRIKLEAKLTPVLLKAHQKLDQARLLFEEAGEEDRAARSWELEQKIYRLLNDL